MDAGTAAVLGALAGSIATIGAALATGWAQREGARITARAEHRRERREPRRDIYKAFISEASNMRVLTNVFASDITRSPTHDPTQEKVELWRRRSESIREKWIDVSLAGPRSVAEAASEIEMQSREMAIILSAYQAQAGREGTRTEGEDSTFRKRLRYGARALDASLKNFVLAAQAALDDDGTQN